MSSRIIPRGTRENRSAAPITAKAPCMMKSRTVTVPGPAGLSPSCPSITPKCQKCHNVKVFTILYISQQLRHWCLVLFNAAFCFCCLEKRAKKDRKYVFTLFTISNKGFYNICFDFLIFWREILVKRMLPRFVNSLVGSVLPVFN